MLSQLSWSNLLVLFNLDNIWVVLFTLTLASLVLYLLLRYLHPLFIDSKLKRARSSSLQFSPIDVGNRAAVVSIKGHRQHMEDTYQSIPKLGHREHWSYYGVFDGHGGARCSAFAAQFLYRFIWSALDDYIGMYSVHNFIENDSKREYDSSAVSVSDTSTNNPKENNPNVMQSNTSLPNGNPENLKKEKTSDNTKKTEISNSENHTSDTVEEIVPNTATNAGKSDQNSKKSPLSDDSPSASDSEQIPTEKTPETETETEDTESQDIMEGNSNSKDTKNNPKRKYKDIPTHIQKIMNDALIQAHRDADEEFLQIANRQQWQDGTTSVSCLILPGRDLIQLLTNPNSHLIEKGKPKPTQRLLKQETSKHSNHSKRKNHMSLDTAQQIEMVSNLCEDGDTWLFVANTGDSRGILVTSDGRGIPMSSDHKPNRMDERRRIESEGGRVVFFGTWRVEGVLAVARALGDRHLKRWVIPDPEIMCRKIHDNDLMLILASDGIWDVLSTADTAKIAVETWNNPAYRNFSIKERLQFVASKLTSVSYRTGSMDNITTLVIHLNTHCTSQGTNFFANSAHKM